MNSADPFIGPGERIIVETAIVHIPTTEEGDYVRVVQPGRHRYPG